MPPAPEVPEGDELLTREQRLEELLRQGDSTLAAARATIDLLDAALRARDEHGELVELPAPSAGRVGAAGAVGADDPGLPEVV